MTDTGEVRTPGEFMRLLEQSRILEDDQLYVVRSMLKETPTGKMLARRLVAKGILTRWQAGQLLVGWTKLRLGNHRLCQQVGRGNYGRVFLAEHIRLKRDVAIKTLSRRFTQLPDVVDRFLEDAREVATLDHPNLVHVLDIDSHDDQYFMVMEYVVGRDLQRLVQEDGPLDFSAAAEYLRQAADGLAYAHQAGIVHREVWPANLMVDDKGVIKILGMGVGRLADMGYDLEAEDADTVPLTLADYQTPEQRRGENQGDIPGDIYSLGCTAYYLLTGQPPPRCETMREPDSTMARDMGLDVTRERHDTPRELASIIGRMTAPESASRFATAEDVARALQNWLVATPMAPAGHALPPAPAASENGPAKTDQGATEPQGGVADPVGVPAIGDIQLVEGADSARLRGGSILNARFWFVAAAFVCAAVLSVAAWRYWPARSPIIASSQKEQPTEKLAVSRPMVVRTDRGERKTDSSPTRLTTMPPAGENTAGMPAASDPAHDGGSATASQAGTPGAPETPAKDAPAAEKPAADPEPKPADEPGAPVADDPWKDFPAAIDLPDLDVADAAGVSLVEVALAPVSLVAGNSLSVALVGGEHAAGKGGRFIVEPDDPGENRSWKFRLESGRGGEHDAITIARLSFRDGHLRFCWEADAALHVLATHLRNCVLRFTLHDDIRDLRLRKAQTVEPLTVDLSRQEVDQRYPLKAVPEAQQMRLEITQLSAPFPAAQKMEPAQVIAADEGKMLVLFGEKSEDQVLILELTSQLRNTLRLECQAFFEVTPKLARIELTPKNFREAATFVAQKQRIDNLGAQRLRVALSQMPQGDPKRREIATNLERAEASLAETSQASQRMARLAELRQKLAEGAAVHFRLFYQADDCEVDLLRTSADGDG